MVESSGAAQALIDIAHPDDRQALITQARDRKLIYAKPDFLPESPYLNWPILRRPKPLKGVSIRFRAMKPSDEDDAPVFLPVFQRDDFLPVFLFR